MEPTRHKPLAVIILNWNGLELMKRLLPGVARFTQSPEVDLIVADNGSTDGSADWVEKNCPGVKVIRLPENFGFAEGYNRAIRECRGYRFTVLLNSDVEVTEGWWRPLLDFMTAHPEAGACQPKIRSFNDRNKFEYAGAAGGYLDRLGYPFCRGRLFDCVEEDRGQYDGAPAEITWATGAALTVDTELYLRLGGLDPKFFAHMEEIDLCLRILRAGRKIYAVTESMVYHIGGASLNQGNPRKTYLNFRNNLLLLHKNSSRVKGRRLLFARRLADTLAFGMYVAKGDFANAKAILKAHSDFRKMKKEYTELPDSDILPTLQGHERMIVIDRYLLGKKK